jgi:YjbE family integral membrane protein
VYNVDWHFIFSWLKIVVLDLTLAGDNALVIAMAVRTLPFRQQRIGIFLGALGAVIVRVSLTFAAAQFLLFPYVQLTGGILLVWIAFKLLRQDNDSEPAIQQCATLFKAIRIIIVADVIMSTDNILAIAGASEGSSFLVLFGLGLSIPIVILGATFIATLMKHCTWIIYLGAGILGEVAAKMILEDNFIEVTLGVPSGVMKWGIRIGLALLVVALGLLLRSPFQELPHRP